MKAPMMMLKMKKLLKLQRSAQAPVTMVAVRVHEDHHEQKSTMRRASYAIAR